MQDAVLLLIVIAVLLLATAVPVWILLAGAQVLRSSLNRPEKNVAVRPALVFWKKLLFGALGGVIGEVIAIAVYRPAEASWCRDMAAQGSYCDGQGPLILAFTVPLCGIIGSCVATVWTWFSLRISSESPYASVFSYRGENRARNAAIAVAVQLAYWSLFALAAYRVTRGLL